MALYICWIGLIKNFKKLNNVIFSKNYWNLDQWASLNAQSHGRPCVGTDNSECTNLAFNSSIEINEIVCRFHRHRKTIIVQAYTKDAHAFQWGLIGRYIHYGHGCRNGWVFMCAIAEKWAKNLKKESFKLKNDIFR
jgi:hypothetical protein